MSVTLRQIRYFLAVAQTGQIGRAAEMLHISQPALSVQIKELEERLGVTVFERQPRKVILTPAGHDMRHHAERVMAEMTALEQSASLARGLTGRFSLGVIPTIAPYLIPQALPLLRAQNLGLELRVREAQTQILLSDLEQGQLDAAVMALPTGAENMQETPLFRDRFLLAGHAQHIQHLVDTNAIPDPVQIAPHQLLLLDEGHCLADQALAACSLNRSATKVDLGASSLSTLCGLVAGGFGVTFLPEIALVREMGSTPDMGVARFEVPQPERQIGLVRRATSKGQGWFQDLSQILQQAGQELIDQAKADIDT
ncbi:LysR substrate-binding domain-containing protein [Aestuariibius sp. HNIBRBA575]|uniref:hydrogen peroxide-inducible genes activator n=1 Tax=Aestuariibius sp. HNIBRBA575 TaxID=3233343 RepID=UPI0034A38EB2